MTKAEKKRFIRELTAAVRDNLLKKVDDMPDEWDGHELRLLLAAKFEREARFDMPRRRKKDFDNEVLVRNL